MTTTDRRRDVRTYVSPPARIRRLGSVERVEILNASYRGLFIRLQGAPPPPAQLLKLEIELPRQAIVVHVIPVRIVTDTSGHAGIGVRFFALNGEDKRAWESYITSLLAPSRAAA